MIVLIFLKANTEVSPVSGLCAVASDPRVGIFSFLFFCYETMSNSAKMLDQLELCRAVF